MSDPLAMLIESDASTTTVRNKKKDATGI